jgi:hypothetical protein
MRIVATQRELSDMLQRAWKLDLDAKQKQQEEKVIAFMARRW